MERALATWVNETVVFRTSYLVIQRFKDRWTKRSFDASSASIAARFGTVMRASFRRTRDWLDV
jgi:hypothetical protein